MPCHVTGLHAVMNMQMRMSCIAANIYIDQHMGSVAARHRLALRVIYDTQGHELKIAGFDHY